MPRLIHKAEGFGPNGETRLVVVRYVSKYEEYVCRVIDNGTHRPNVGYFTNDRQDAIDTANAMVKRHNERGRDGVP
jgi:hypothetical protein